MRFCSTCSVARRRSRSSTLDDSAGSMPVCAGDGVRERVRVGCGSWSTRQTRAPRADSICMTHRRAGSPCRPPSLLPSDAVCCLPSGGVHQPPLVRHLALARAIASQPSTEPSTAPSTHARSPGAICTRPAVGGGRLADAAPRDGTRTASRLRVRRGNRSAVARCGHVRASEWT